MKGKNNERETADKTRLASDLNKLATNGGEWSRWSVGAAYAQAVLVEAARSQPQLTAEGQAGQPRLQSPALSDGRGGPRAYQYVNRGLQQMLMQAAKKNNQ